ncbi:MAG: hypothetical protein ACLQCB_18300 [Spirochaetia bacterium]
MARHKRMRLATWLVSHNLMTLDQAHEVMREQKEQTGHIRERFGRIAVKKGFISEEALTRAYLEKEREEALLRPVM